MPSPCLGQRGARDLGGGPGDARPVASGVPGRTGGDHRPAHADVRKAPITAGLPRAP